jgi:hypothetical protein
MTNWHRLFGLFLMDFSTNSPYVVEREKDLSLKQQFLDEVIFHSGKRGQFRTVSRTHAFRALYSSYQGIISSVKGALKFFKSNLFF